DALKGDLYTAMTLNGFVYSAALGISNEAAVAAIKEGALAAGLSGTGPAVVALTRDSPSKIVSAWQTLDGDIMTTKVNNQRAKIIE
ncbi:MAG: shikimate kinase, partial [Candidatus Altiarchaeota archaeon]|nr:shikimate kinase [Candidatus Altiarchaeota archaeon]